MSNLFILTFASGSSKIASKNAAEAFESADPLFNFNLISFNSD